MILLIYSIARVLTWSSKVLILAFPVTAEKLSTNSFCFPAGEYLNILINYIFQKLKVILPCLIFFKILNNFIGDKLRTCTIITALIQQYISEFLI